MEMKTLKTLQFGLAHKRIVSADSIYDMDISRVLDLWSQLIDYLKKEKEAKEKAMLSLNRMRKKR